MSDLLNEMLTELNARLDGSAFDGTAKLDVAGEGSIVFSSASAEISDADADVTLSADADTLRAIFEKDLDPTSAFMSGKLSIDGDMGLAMQLASVLS
ncbi:MAG: SCP2 sterol-binding domain-containing protein [Marinibacterium sp.]